VSYTEWQLIFLLLLLAYALVCLLICGLGIWQLRTSRLWKIPSADRLAMHGGPERLAKKQGMLKIYAGATLLACGAYLFCRIFFGNGVQVP
jgi:uncharacterized iron-regulated membrane protein